MPPLRIASLLASSTEMLYALGLGDRVVAVSHECDFPPEAALKPRATRTLLEAHLPSGQIDVQVKHLLAAGQPLYEIDIALLARLSPELIVTQAQCDVCAVRYQDVIDAVAATPALGGTQVVALNPQSLDDVLGDILRVGHAADCREAAEHYVASLQDRIRRVRTLTATLRSDERPRIACIEWIQPLMIAGNWMPDLIALAGGDCPLTEAGRHSPYVPWSDIATFDPQVIVVMPCGFDLPRTLDEAGTLSELPGWLDVSAVRAGRVFAVDGNAYFNRSGPRMVDSLELLAHLLHPAQFRDLSPPGRRIWAQL